MRIFKVFIFTAVLVFSQKKNLLINTIDSSSVGSQLEDSLNNDPRLTIKYQLNSFDFDSLQTSYSIINQRKMIDTLIFVYNNYPFGEYEIKLNNIRKFGKSNVVINDGFKSIYNAIRVLTLFNPAIFYSKLGIIIILIGSFYSLYKAFINNIGIPTLGALIIILGILIIFFGLIADQISNLRLSQIDSDNEK